MLKTFLQKQRDQKLEGEALSAPCGVERDHTPLGRQDENSHPNAESVPVLLLVIP
jgi:hypothetical protein